MVFLKIGNMMRKRGRGQGGAVDTDKQITITDNNICRLRRHLRVCKNRSNGMNYDCIMSRLHSRFILISHRLCITHISILLSRLYKLYGVRNVNLILLLTE